MTADDLSEETTSSKKKSSGKIQSVGIGRGRLKFAVQETGALAKEDPGKLMSNLKIGGVKNSKDQVEVLKDLLEKAANGTEEMSAVYSVSSNQPKAKDKEGEPVESVVVDVSLIEPRDAQKYIEHTLVGASAAFNIKWDKNVDVTRSGNKVVVFLR